MIAGVLIAIKAGYGHPAAPPKAILVQGRSAGKIILEMGRDIQMPVVKVVELVADSPDGWKDAINEAVAKASETIHNISGVEVKNLTASVKDGKIVDYKANLHLAFKVDE